MTLRLRCSWSAHTLLLPLMALLALGGCEPAGQNASTTPAPSAGTQARTGYEIGMVAKSQSNPVFRAARRGAEQAARDLSEELGVDISISWRTPTRENAALQTQYIEQLVSQGVDGIAISVSDAELLTPSIDDAVLKGVTVVCFDSDAPESQRLCHYGVDDREAGRELMRRLAEAIGGQGVVGVLAGNPGAPNLQTRTAGIRDIAGEMQGIAIRDVFFHAETAQAARDRLAAAQRNHPEIMGWAFVGGWPLYADDGLSSLPSTVHIVSMDPLPRPLRQLQSGRVAALVGQPYYDWGYRSVSLIVDSLHRSKMPESDRIHAEIEIVTPDTADEFTGRWDVWLGSDGR